MGKKITAFGNIEIGKCKFYNCKNPTLLEDLDIDKIQVSSMVSSAEKNYKYFIGYKDFDDDKIKPLCIMLPKMSAYIKSYDGDTK